jgi:hypothetical protein
MGDKSKAKAISKLSSVWKDIKNPGKQSELNKNISLYNVMVMHNYYCIATLVSADFAEVVFKVTRKSDGMNYNRCRLLLERQGEITSKYILEKYGKSKQFRWVKGRVIISAGYVEYEYRSTKGVKSTNMQEKTNKLRQHRSYTYSYLVIIMCVHTAIMVIKPNVARSAS